VAWEAPAPAPEVGTITLANDGREVSNGKGLKYRMVGNRKVAAIGPEISDQDIDHIQALTTWLVDRSGPLEVAVAHAGSGQSAAAIYSELPEGSHLYALDSVNTYQFSNEPADHFTASFQPELESGRVMADLYSRKFPWPTNQQHLDMVFIERALTIEKLNSWSINVREGGLIAGLGYNDPKTRKIVDAFVESNQLKLRAAGDVWATPK
jgi:hypothetical protein